MVRTSVASSNLASVGYDTQRQILEVGFRDGAVYQYFGVPQSVYAGLMAASSHGSYFDAFVKKMGYRYQRVA